MIYTIITAVLVAAASVFAVMYFREKKTGHTGNNVLLTSEVILEFLQEERGIKAEYDSSTGILLFFIGDYMFNINCSRVPQYFILYKGFNMTDKDYDWNALKESSYKVQEKIMLVKMNVDSDDRSCCFYITGMDRTLASLRVNFDVYMQLISEAERMFSEGYCSITNAEESGASAQYAEMIEKMAHESGKSDLRS